MIENRKARTYFIETWERGLMSPGRRMSCLTLRIWDGERALLREENVRFFTKILNRSRQVNMFIHHVRSLDRFKASPFFFFPYKSLINHRLQNNWVYTPECFRTSIIEKHIWVLLASCLSRIPGKQWMVSEVVWDPDLQSISCVPSSAENSVSMALTLEKQGEGFCMVRKCLSFPTRLLLAIRIAFSIAETRNQWIHLDVDVNVCCNSWGSLIQCQTKKCFCKKMCANRGNKQKHLPILAETEMKSIDIREVCQWLLWWLCCSVDPARGMAGAVVGRKMPPANGKTQLVMKWHFSIYWVLSVTVLFLSNRRKKKLLGRQTG